MKVFDLFVYAIVALILVAIFLAIAQNFPPAGDTTIMIKQTIDSARIDPNLGKLFLVGSLDYKKDELITSTGLTIDETLTSIECTNPQICCVRKSQQNEKDECDKIFEWDYDYLKPRESKKANTFVRCVDIDTINTCKVYVGLMPAQAEVKQVENIGTNMEGNTEIKSVLKNSGQTTLSNATAQLKLFKKVDTKWIQTDYEIEAQEIQILQPGEERVLYWEVKTQNLGKYKATILFEAKDAGFNQNSVEFDRNENYYCKTTTIGETIYNAQNNNYEELHHCEGCNYAHECANAWNNKSVQVTYYPKNKDYAYCTKNTSLESC